MQIPETEITEAFLRIYFTLKHHGDQVLTQLIQDLQTAKNGKLLWSEDIVELNKQIADIACQERLLAQLKQQAVVDPDIFIFQSNQLAEQRREAKLKKSRILRSEDDQTVQRTQELLDILEDGPDLLMTFDEALFSELVETITIQDDSTIRFRLINGLELPEHIERKKINRWQASEKWSLATTWSLGTSSLLPTRPKRCGTSTHGTSPVRHSSAWQTS